MKDKILFYIVFLLTASIWSVEAQTLNEICELDLPVMIINTVNGEKPTSEVLKHPPGATGVGRTNATKVPCSVSIRFKDETLYESGEYVEDKSGAKINIRGNTTASNIQKPYKIKLEKKADLLLRGDDNKYKDKEWALLYENDLKTFIGFTVNKLVDMPYKLDFRPINVFMNNEYIGIYYLTETVKRNESCRINVDKETGYIFEYDLYWWNTDYYIPVEFNTTLFGFTLKYPDSKDATDDEKTYIEDWIKELQYAIMDGHAEDYLCLDTCARWILARDLIGNSDGGGSNLFFAKDDNSTETKAYPPTLWDFDGVCNKSEVWSSSHIWPGTFFYNMFNYHRNKEFATVYCKEWIKMTENNVTEKLIKELNDFAASDEGKALEISYNYTGRYCGGRITDWSITDKVKEYEGWFRARQKWLDNAINDQFFDIMLWLKYKYVYPDVAFDILGKKNPGFYKGIKIIDGKKYMGTRMWP